MREGIIFTIISGLIFSVIVILWVIGIDNMKKNRPKYKGDGFLSEEKDEKK